MVEVDTRSAARAHVVESSAVPALHPVQKPSQKPLEVYTTAAQEHNKEPLQAFFIALFKTDSLLSLVMLQPPSFPETPENTH